MRIVLDTSVVVSAVLLPRSVPRQAFDDAIARGTLLVSEATMTELDEVLRRPKFDKYLPFALRLEFLAALVTVADVVAINLAVSECRDPRDDMFLSLAVNGRADFFVTGDQDLLILHPFQEISIVTPASFLARSAQTE